MEILSPVLAPGKGDLPLAKRLDTIAGKSIGFLWNNRAHGDTLLSRLKDLLESKYEIRSTIYRKKEYFGERAPTEIIEELSSSCDAVIMAVGD